MQGVPLEEILWLFAGLVVFFFLFIYAFRIVNSIVILPFILIATAFRKVLWLDLLARISSVFAIDYLVYLSSYGIVKIDPGRSDAWLLLGAYFEKKNNLSKAEEYYRKSLSLDHGKDGCLVLAWRHKFQKAGL